MLINNKNTAKTRQKVGNALNPLCDCDRTSKQQQRFELGMSNQKSIFTNLFSTLDNGDFNEVNTTEGGSDHNGGIGHGCMCNSLCRRCKR